MFKKPLLIFIIFLELIMANQLKYETSPYLLQHKDNPVHWYPWGKQAFSKAKKENKLIFLSIGYSTCHWCHVMAQESFENKEVAKVLNQDFVSIKVDREQFPHIDSYYQKVYNIMNNRGGGWPLTIILTPHMEPFFSATYMPRNGGYGSRGLIDTLKEIAGYDRKKLQAQGKQVLKIVNSESHMTLSHATFDTKLSRKIVNHFQHSYDNEYKGFGTQPKFPQFTNLILLLKIYQINGNQKALTMAVDSLKAMAKGGIFDQIEGAFYRYSVDRKWAIPHFEKMLYTNAEALEAYSLAFQMTKEPLFKEVIDKTISQIDERFLKDGVYKSASNADSKNAQGENKEGYYFIYDYRESLEYLEKNGVNKDESKEVLHYLGITKDGNFHAAYSNPEIVGTQKPKAIKKVISLLKQIRKTKAYPFIDYKINTAWNALYLKGRLMASSVDKKYLKKTLDSLDSLIKLMYRNGQLYHQTVQGKTPTQKGILEDYSFMINALFEAYQMTLDNKYLSLYEKLVKESIKLFYKDGRWTQSNDGFKTYADIDENSYASALGVHFSNLILYATAQSDSKTLEIVKKSMGYYVREINTYPSYFPSASFASLLLHMEPVFIKAKKQNLESFSTHRFKYPFVYKKEYDTNEYLACKLSSCFSYSTDINKIIKDVNSLKK